MKGRKGKKYAQPPQFHSSLEEKDKGKIAFERVVQLLCCGAQCNRRIRSASSLAQCSIIVSARSGKSVWSLMRSSRAREGATASGWSACWLHLHQLVGQLVSTGHCTGLRSERCCSCQLLWSRSSTSCHHSVCCHYSVWSFPASPPKIFSDVTILLLLVWTAGGNVFRN